MSNQANNSNSSMMEDDFRRLQGRAFIDLLEVDCTNSGGDIFHITPTYNRNSPDGSYSFRGMVFTPVPFESEGWSWNGDGTLPRPTVKIADTDGTLLNQVWAYQDIIGAKVTRWIANRESFVDGTDGTQVPFFGPEIYLVHQKLEANGDYIKFSLAMPFDFSQQKIPGRQMLRKDFYSMQRNRL